MSVDWLSGTGQELPTELGKFRDTLLSWDEEGDATLTDIAQLFSNDQSLWNKIKCTFNHDPRAFDRLLLKLHYKRNASFDETKKHNILKFLTIGYLLTGDVRYFNEVLFFRDNQRDNFLLLCRDKFGNSLVDGRHHLFPLGNRLTVDSFIANMEATESERKGHLDIPDKAECRIGLFGNPLGFQSLYESLRADGVPCSFFHMVQFQMMNDVFSYQRSAMKRWIWRNYLIARAYLWAKRYRSSYIRITDPVSSPKITETIAARGIDLGVHRLYSIVRNNVTQAVRFGILNDHVGVLPFVRGWSTIEYSILFGFPVGATVHLMDEGVDTGPIVRFFPLEANPERESLAQLVDRLCQGHNERLADTVKYLIADKPEPVPNDYGSGLQYFLMHGELREYVESIV